MRADTIDRLDQWRGWALCGGLTAGAVAYSFRLTSFLHAKDAVLAVAAIVVAALILVREWGVSRSPEVVSGRDTASEGLRWESFAPLLPLWLLVVYSLGVHYLARQAAVPRFVLVELVRMTLLLLTASLAWDLLRTAPWRARLVDAVAVSATAVAALALVQWADLAPALFPKFDGAGQRMYSVFGNRDLLGGYLAMGVPLMAHRCAQGGRARREAWAMLLVCAAALVLCGSRSAWLACVVGVCVLVWQTRGAVGGEPVGRRRWVKVVLLVAVVTAGAVAVSPESTLGRIRGTFTADDSGGRLRLWFWDGAVRMVRDHPLVGVGPGNFAYWSPRYQGEALWAGGPARHAFNEVHTRHAHCDPLEVLAETGAIALVLVAWMVSRVLRCKGPEWGGLAALLAFSLLNFPLRSGPHVLAGLILALALMRRNEASARRPVGSEARRYAFAAFAAAVVLAVYGWMAVTGPSFALRRAMDRHLTKGAEAALADYARALDSRFALPETHEKYGIALFESGRFAEARQAFERALDGLDTGSVYLALGALDVRLGDNASAQRHLRECVRRWPGNVDAWTLLLRAADTDARASVLEEARPWVSPETHQRLREELEASEDQ
ncbi:MAG: hypothetical protein GY851_18250 [bacterium]|nr:hypothetical protein [bacterium]